MLNIFKTRQGLFLAEKLDKLWPQKAEICIQSAKMH